MSPGPRSRRLGPPDAALTPYRPHPISGGLRGVTACPPTRGKNSSFEINQMAGMPGRSGGARPGAGRKRTPIVQTDITDPLQFLIEVMAGRIRPAAVQVRAAIGAARLTGIRSCLPS